MITENQIREILQNTDDRGYLRARESSQLEFKESFVFGNLAKYLKTIGSFANTKGGVLLFGIKNSPRLPIGVDRDRFDSIEQEKISTFLSEYFSPEILWDLGLIEHDSKYFGYLVIREAVNKPVICKKDAGKILKNGEIYYRYRGQSRAIAFPELKKIHDDIRETERSLWMKHVEKIAKIGPQSVAFVDLFEGAIETSSSSKQLLIDPSLFKELKKQVNFIEEGSFSEKDGAPTLKVIGDIVSTDGVIIPDLDPNKDYPFLAKHLAQELGIRIYDVQVLIWDLGLKGNKKYHIAIETSKSTTANKYSRFALRILKKTIEEQKDKTTYLNRLSKKYYHSIRKEKP